MGIPKFFRWMSERYPLTSQLIQEGSIPEFDNLYLDMNGVIHNCSHANNESAHYRISEEQIYLQVFAYIEHLFAKIKPKKLFFMAVDGVAPRAKMNQQRSRRFRTAREAKEVKDRALAKGEELPAEDAFDSNCITPGTPFMARLSKQLQYFIAKKVNEDADWRGIQVVLSGHEVPGEGEHKIMEYIRLAKAQPDYNPNVRHCLYGLDADLIMLGLLSHDPHFCLLREEVVFGPARKKQRTSLETQNFYLMHLSLLREYLDMEFASLAENVDFEYDLERIIDDFILLAIFVGNDFLPHLPGLHINEGALNLLYGIYKKVLPRAGGYINEHGTLNVKRLQMILDELAQFEQDTFEQEFADSNWFKGKQQNTISALEKARAKSKLVLTQDQRYLFNEIAKFVRMTFSSPSPGAQVQFPAIYPARDRRFLQDLANALHLSIAFDEFDDNDEPVIVLRFDEEVFSSMMQELSLNGKEEEGEWRDAVNRVLNKYEKAQTLEDQTESDFEEAYEIKLKEKMHGWKKEYYQEKFRFDMDQTPEDLQQLCYRYVEGLQWVLHYYYNGVASWGWFYDYHYSPKISDLSNIANFKFAFKLGTPFKPFEQLMGVLPDLSNQHIPAAYRDLMSDPESPIIDFYPRDFETDMNGKKQDWEAVVKIPFIDQDRLLSTMATREHHLTAEERSRNSWGNSWSCTWEAGRDAVYPSPQPGFLPDLYHCGSVLVPFDLPTLSGLKLVKGLCEGVLLGKDAVAGFPSLFTLPHSGQLGFHGVAVFQGDSKNETMVLTVENTFEGVVVENVAKELVGKTIYAGWPFLKEALVTGISDDLFRYEMDQNSSTVGKLPHRPESLVGWRKAAERIEHQYSKRYGTLIGDVNIVLNVRLLKGLKQVDDGALVKEFEPKETEQALQLTVKNVSSLDQRYIERDAIPVEEDIPVGSKVFYLGQRAAFGIPAQVNDHINGTLSIITLTYPGETAEYGRYKDILFQNRYNDIYHPSFNVNKRAHMSGLTLSKITSSLMIHGTTDQKVNAGLNLKFEAKGQKVLGYTRKSEGGWEYSERAIALISEYKAAFPEIIEAFDTRRGSDLRSITEFFPQLDAKAADAKMREIKMWLKEKGVDDLEKVPLDSEQLDKTVVHQLEQLADKLTASKSPDQLKRQQARSIPRRAVLKPEQAKTRLQHQTFRLGDRVVMAAETGNVPLSTKGTVVGIRPDFMDVLWDVGFIGGTTLGERCSPYRGLPVAPWTLLNLSTPQLQVQPSGAAPPPIAPRGRGRGRGFFTPAPASNRGQANGPVRILQSNRGRGAPSGAFASNYQAAATNQDGAYTPHRPASHQAKLRQAFSNNAAAAQANAQTYENNRPPQLPRNDYSSVPPPSVLTAPSSSRRGRGVARISQNASAAVGRHLTNGAAPNGHVPTGPRVESLPNQRGRGNLRGRGRGKAASEGPLVVTSGLAQVNGADK